MKKYLLICFFGITCLPANSQRKDSLLYKIASQKILPAIGYNKYDGFQLGVLVHNYHQPSSRLHYLVAPVYAFNSKRPAGLGEVNYTWKGGAFIQAVEAGVNISTASTMRGSDSLGKKVFGSFYKLAPYVRLTLPAASSDNEVWVEFRTYIIGEKGFEYDISGADSLYYPSEGKTTTRYLNQLTFNTSSSRTDFPYNVQLQLQQAASFYRFNANAYYFLNYAKKGGLQARLFAAKFGYLGTKTASKEFATYRYQPKLTAVRGNEDYTYSNYFIGRNEFEGFSAQQIMMRDGGLKLRTDQFQDLQGKSDNWVASLNFNTTLPHTIFPEKFPVSIFLDIGTYGALWTKESEEARFLYVAGLQLSLFKELINVYAPLMYSKKFRDNLKTLPEENKFLRRLSFSIDVHRFGLRKLAKQKLSS